MDQLTAIASAIAALAGAVTAVALLARAWKTGATADVEPDTGARDHTGRQRLGPFNVLIVQPAARCQRCGEGLRPCDATEAPAAGLDARPPHGNTIA